MKNLLIAMLLLAPTGALAQADLFGFDRYPHFRGLSGLAGGGYGLDEQGYPSLSGATAYSTPVAHVIGHGHFRAFYSAVGADAGISSDMFRAHRPGVHHVLLEGGITAGPVNLMLSDMRLSTALDSALSFQAQLIPQKGQRYSLSAGVQNFLRAGGAAGHGLPGDTRSSRSFFGVVTYRATEGEKPVYVSAGAGTRRFSGGFLSVSKQVTTPIRVWAEYDGFAPNFGFTAAAFKGAGTKRIEFDGSLGLIDYRYLTIALGVGF